LRTTSSRDEGESRRWKTGLPLQFEMQPNWMQVVPSNLSAAVDRAVRHALEGAGGLLDEECPFALLA